MKVWAEEENEKKNRRLANGRKEWRKHNEGGMKEDEERKIKVEIEE